MSKESELDSDLTDQSASDLRYEVKKLRAGIRKHRDSSGHDLCWYHPELWDLLPEEEVYNEDGTRKRPKPEIPPWNEFMEKCAAYRASLDGKKKVPHVYEYPRPSVTVDCLIVKQSLVSSSSILTIKRRNDPYKDCVALPGGFVEMGEGLLAGAKRELLEETGIADVKWLGQIGAFGSPKRDPRGRVISVAFIGVVGANVVATAGDDAKDAEWIPFTNIQTTQFAFDHADVVEMGLGIWCNYVAGFPQRVLE